MTHPRPQRRGVLGWFLDRSGAAAGWDEACRVGTKLVPTRLSWIYTTGALALFFFGLQIVTGCLLLTVYVPEETLAYPSIQTIEHRAELGWLVRQMHSWGASFVILVLVFHVLKVLWYGSYKRPREFTWFAGCLLFAVAMAFCFSGYLLPWNQLSFWATRVAVEAMDSVPWLGPPLKQLLCGGSEVSGETIGRFFALHVVVLPAALVGIVGYHLFLITTRGTAPKTTVKEELEIGNAAALRRHGAETFFPRQVYRDLIACNLGFALLVTAATFWPWELGEPASFDTPKGIKPEWYFLPMYQLLKYFPNKFLAVVLMNLVAALLFFLPVLDRGGERQLRRRPFFSLLAYLLLGGILFLGVLGALADRELELFGTKVRFNTLAVPGVVEEPPAGSGETSERDEEGGAGREETEEEEKGEEDEGEGDGDDGAKKPESGGAGGSAGEGPPEGGDDPEPDGTPGSGGNASAATFREDGLPPGGTCAGCHEDQAGEWRGSVHFANQVECVSCHGGIDVRPPALVIAALAKTPEDEECDPEVEGDEWGLYLYAHDGVMRSPKGCPTTPKRSAVQSFCAGACHGDVGAVFAARHVEESPKKTCHHCHSNHAVEPAGFATYEKGYADESEAKTQPFEEIKGLFEALEKKAAAVKTTLEDLEELHFPVEELREEYEALASRAGVGETRGEVSVRALVHTLDPAKVREGVSGLGAVPDIPGIDGTTEELEKLETEMRAVLDGRDDRWVFVAVVWGIALLFSWLFHRRLRTLPPAGRPTPTESRSLVEEDTPAVAEREAEQLARAGDERGALLFPLADGRDPDRRDDAKEGEKEEEKDDGKEEDPPGPG